MLADRLADGVAGQQTFGGIDMTVRRNAFGRQVDSFESDITLSGLGDGDAAAAASGLYPGPLGGAEWRERRRPGHRGAHR